MQDAAIWYRRVQGASDVGGWAMFPPDGSIDDPAESFVIFWSSFEPEAKFSAGSF